MTDVGKYFRFLSTTYALEMLTEAQNGLIGPEGMPKLTRKQFYSRLHMARQLGLIIRRKDGYHLTALGEIILDKTRSITALDPTKFMLKTIDLLEDNDLRIQAIHHFFSESPEIERVLMHPN